MEGKKCVTGKSCSSACVDPNKKCKKIFPESVQSALKNAPHMLEHVGINVLSWKVGKVVGPMVSGVLETQYGIPRESSQMLSEALVQAITAVGLNFRHIRSSEDLIKNLLIEASAATLGKGAHTGTENFLTSTEGKEILKEALPLLAGKFTGIGVAFAGAKIPSISKLSGIVSQRSQSDLEKLKSLLSPKTFNASEDSDLNQVSEFLSDILVLSLIRSSRLS